MLSPKYVDNLVHNTVDFTRCARYQAAFFVVIKI